MDILVLNGSPRPNGNTAALVCAFAGGAREAGHAVEVIDVAALDIAGLRVLPYEGGRRLRPARRHGAGVRALERGRHAGVGEPCILRLVLGTAALRHPPHLRPRRA
ncbi:flavodoxin family protein [Gordonibacter urolithinfaciens]|uniref:flavodoxin family protein n=1 Tax=Gordonibacter urolithinfaciens TaxID=1335613 RepID=UPI0022B2678A|nr:NAD(P)H-dependent oxidoreductase [Gordonibacter urolithinfaciens]